MNPSSTQTRGTLAGQQAAQRIAEARDARNKARVLTSGGQPVPKKSAVTTPAPITPPTTPAGATAITGATLAPTTPVTLAEPTPATQATGMMAEFQDGTDTYTANLEAQAKAAEAPKQNALNDYISQLTSAKGLTGLTADAYAEKGGVNDITPELDNINDQIRREQLSMRRRTEAIQAGGGLKAGAASEIANIERDSFAKQADLSVIQQAVQGRYDSAKEIADRAVSAQLEKQTNDLAILKFNYDENKELFTKAEQRAFEAAQGDRERKLEAERQDKQSKYELGIQASADGAPSSVVQRMFAAKTREEALAIGGSYIGALDREAKRANIAQSYAAAAASNRSNQPVSTVGATLPSFEEYLASVAPNQSISPDGRAKYEAEYNNLKKQAVVSTMTPLAQAITQAPEQYKSLSATDKAEVLPQLVAAGIKIPKDLNGEQLKAQNLAQSGLQAMQELQSLIPDQKVGVWQSINPFGAYATQRRGVVDAISRIRTGAAMTPSEEKFYNSMIPGAFDQPEVVTKKNEQLAVFLSGIGGNTVMLQSPDGQIYSYDDLMNPDQRKETRDALEEGWTLVDY